MNLSALAGLGAGLQAFGGAWTDKNKQDFAKQLEMEREKRAEARQLAKEERDAKRLENTVAETRAEQDEDGVWWMRGYNAAGTPKGEPRLATQGEIQSASMQRYKDKVSLDKLVADAALAQHKADRAPIEAAQDDETHRARLGLVGAQTRAANYRASDGGRSALDGSDNSGVSDDIEDTVNGLVAQAKDAGVSMADISRLREQAQSMPTRGVRGTKWAPTPEEANRNFIRLLDEFIKTAQKTPESLIRRRPSALDEE